MSRLSRMRILACYFVTGALVLQLGPLCTMVNSTLTTGVGTSGFLIDNNGNLLGIPFFNMCGQPDIQTVDENGVPLDLLNTEDDLMLGCPVTVIVVADGGDGDG